MSAAPPAPRAQLTPARAPCRSKRLLTLLRALRHRRRQRLLRRRFNPYVAGAPVLDEDLFWQVPDLLDKLALGVSWLERVVVEQPIEVLRADLTSVHATHFWVYATSTLPRGVEFDPDAPEKLRYTLEASLWMVFYEILTHIRTVQRLKRHQGLRLAVELPRVGYLRLPEYWGDTDANGPSMQRIRVG